MASRAQPREKVLNLTGTRQHVGQFIAEVARGDTYVVVEKNGMASAVIVEPEKFRRYQRIAEVVETQAHEETFNSRGSRSLAWQGLSARQG